MSRQQRTAEELLLDMRREAEDPWRYYHYGRKPRTIMLPIRVTDRERAAIRAAAKWENKKVSEFIRAAIADRAAEGFCKAGGDGLRDPERV